MKHAAPYSWTSQLFPASIRSQGHAFAWTVGNQTGIVATLQTAKATVDQLCEALA